MTDLQRAIFRYLYEWRFENQLGLKKPYVMLFIDLQTMFLIDLEKYGVYNDAT